MEVDRGKSVPLTMRTEVAMLIMAVNLHKKSTYNDTDFDPNK